MKKYGLLFFISTFVAVASFAFTADDLNKVTFANNLNGNRSIEYIFFSPGDSKYWGPNIIEKGKRLTKGQKSEFLIFYPEKTGEFDLMAIDGDGKVYEITDVVVSDGEEKTISITDKMKTSKTKKSMALAEIVLTNNTNENLDYVFLAPSDSVIWGLELLSSQESLEPGAEKTFLVPLADDGFDMDFLAIAGNDDRYKKTVSVGTEEEIIECAVSSDDLQEEE